MASHAMASVFLRLRLENEEPPVVGRDANWGVSINPAGALSWGR